MKNLLFAVSFVVVSGSAAMAQTTPVVSCSNAQGVEVSITNSGMGLGATVTKHAVAQPGQATPQYIMVLKSFTPVNGKFMGMQQVWAGPGFQMVISLESFAPTMTHPATLRIVGNNGTPYQTSVICSSNR